MYCTRFDRKTYTEELIYLGHYINMNTNEVKEIKNGKQNRSIIQ